MKRGCSVLIFFALIVPSFVFAITNEELKHENELTMIANSRCNSEIIKGKEYDIKVTGDGNIEVSFFGKKGGSLNGVFTYTRKEWEGRQRVLQKHQASETTNRRECLREEINDLKKRYSPSSKIDIDLILLNGMTYPDKNIEEASPSLIIHSRIIDESYGIINDKPWRRKALVHSDSNKQEFFQPRATIVDSRLHILYLAKAWNENTLFLYELIPASGKNNMIERLPYKYGSGHHFDDENNLVIKGGYLYYFLGSDHNGRRYKIGSQEKPKKVNFYSARNRMFYTSISPDGRFIAAPNAGYVNDLAPEPYRLATRGQKKKKKSWFDGEYTGISLYDKKLDSNSVLFKQSYTGDWSIGSIIWSDDSENLFFDNSGSIACIWKYSISHRVLQKIIPEHEADSPFFLRLNGREYIFYVETKMRDSNFYAQPIGSPSPILTSRLMIATE